MKLAVNTVIFGLNEAVAEGLVLAEAAGVDRAMAYDVFAASAVGAPYVGYKRAAFVEPEATPVAFSLDLAAKDLGLIRDLADRRRRSRCPRRGRTSTCIRTAAAALGGGTDFSTVAIAPAQSSGRESRRTRQEGRDDRTASRTDGPAGTRSSGKGSNQWPTGS